MPLPVYHYVSVVSVFDREKVREYAVSSQTPNEVGLRLFELVSEVPLVEISQVTQLRLLRLYHLLFEGVDGDGVRHEFKHG